MTISARNWFRIFTGFFLLAATSASLMAAPGAASATGPASASGTAPGATAGAATHWVASWGAAMQIPEPQNALPVGDLDHAVLRQLVHLSLGGSQLRIRVSNAFGVVPLRIDSVHVARAISPATSVIDPASDRAVLFAGKESVVVPAGAEYVSDPVTLDVAPLSTLTVTLAIPDAPPQQTGHPGSRATTWVAHGIATWIAHGVTTSAVQMPEENSPDARSSDAHTVEHWYFLSGVDVAAPEPQAASIIAFGDSITDGHAATTNGDDRWTDDLAARLQANPATRSLSVINTGIGGNHLLTDGLGPNALARFDRDVLARPAAKYLIVLEAINDLGALSRMPDATAAQHADLQARLIAAYQQIILRAHAAGLTVIGGTLTPYEGSGYYHPDAASEADRQALNAWIRTPGHFDAVVDFDRAVRDPANPARMLPALDSGDHLHPSPAGYKAMADAIPLTLFTH